MDAEVTWFTNGTSLILDGQRCAVVAVDSNTEVICAELLLAEMSAKKAGLEALTKALELRKIRDTDSPFGFATAHVCVVFPGREAL